MEACRSRCMPFSSYLPQSDGAAKAVSNGRAISGWATRESRSRPRRARTALRCANTARGAVESASACPEGPEADAAPRLAWWPGLQARSRNALCPRCNGDSGPGRPVWKPGREADTELGRWPLPADPGGCRRTPAARRLPASSGNPLQAKPLASGKTACAGIPATPKQNPAGSQASPERMNWRHASSELRQSLICSARWPFVTPPSRSRSISI